MKVNPDHNSRNPCYHTDVEEIATALNQMSDAGRNIGITAPVLDEAAHILRKLSDQLAHYENKKEN
jgi:hypothetical protein